jgi:hypothetical protein
MRLYWHRYTALPVTLNLRRVHQFHWTQIRGIQIGSWFIGAIQGHEVKAR